MKRLYLLAFLLCFSLTAYAEKLPRPSAWVNDFGSVLSEDYKNKLTSLIDELEAKTSAEIFVVTQSSISPYDEKEYARMLFDNWKPGKIGKDNGVLVLLAIKERRWRIETGYGVEGILTDGLSGEIGRNYMAPYFKNGEYGKGLYYGVTAISKVIAQSANVDLDALKGLNFSKLSAKKSPAYIFIYLFAFFFFLIWNLPWPVYIGLPFTLIFAAAFFQISFLAGALVVLGYLSSMFIRYNYWSKLPPDKRNNFFGPIIFGGISSGGYGGFGGGGFGGGGFGGGGGGCGGGGGSGGGF